MSSNSRKKNARFYDVMAQYIPQFARVRSISTTTRAPAGYRRGALTSLTHKKIELPDLDKEDEELDNHTSWKPNVHLRTDPIRVNPVISVKKKAQPKFSINVKFESETDSVTDDLAPFSATSVIPLSGRFESLSATASATSSALSSARSGYISGVGSAIASPIYSARDVPAYEDQPEQLFSMNDEDDDGFKMPEIPPLATDLIQFLATIPDSAPASLSPFTFCEEVVGLQGQDFEQYLEEDTLCLKSVLFGNRFNEDTIYDFFISLTEDQYMTAFEIVFRQYFKLARLSNLIRDLLKVESVQELGLRIEKECERLFGARTTMVWINIGSAKTLVNHSRLMKYPHGVGLVGTAAAEKRQVVAPNPTSSPIYCEEYDFPFCEEAEMIIVEPIINPKTNHLYGVIMMIDKVHRNGASYMYWPQSELTLLHFFSSNLYRVFDKFDKDIRATAKLYRVIAKYMANQLDFFRLLGTVKNTIAQLLKCESVSILFREGKQVFWFETNGTNVSRNSCSTVKAGIAGYVFEHNVFVHCACARDHPAFNSAMDGRYKSRSALAIPLTSGRDVFSVIVCRSKKLLPCFTSEDVHNLSFIGAGAAPALQMAMSYRKKLNELRIALRAQDRLAALLQTAESLSRETNIDALIDTILHNACNLIGADRASLFVIDESRTHLISKVAHGTTKPLLLPIGNGIAGHVATTGETINIPDVYEDPRFNSNVDKATGYRTKSLMTIPVHDQQGNIIAVAQLMNKLSGEPFTDSDVELTKAMCVFTGIALANATVIESSLMSTQRVHALLDTSFLLMSGESLSSVLHHIMSVSRDLVQADRCGLFMISADKERIKSTVLAGEENQIIVKRGKGVVGYVAQHNQLVNIDDAYKDKRFHSGVDQATGYRTRSILAAPVVDHRNKVIGVVEMINKDQLYNGGTFTKEDEKLTTAFASFAGIAFDKKSMTKTEGGDGQTLAILLSNMMTADESNSCQPPYQVVFPQEKLKHYRSNRFDVSQLKTLDGFKLIISMFFDLGFSTTFQINNAKLIRFLLAVHDLHHGGMHSWERTLESAQFMYYLLTTTELPEMLSKLECFALFIAAICKDIDHYNLEDKSRSDIALAVLYRNRPVMEMHHCEQTIRIISKPEQNIFENIEQDQQVQLWQLIISLILGTDMAQHFELVNKMKVLVYPQMLFNPQSPQHRLLLSQIVVKCCDMSSTTRLFPIHEKWANMMPRYPETSDNPEEADRAIAKSQLGYFMFIARPLFHVLRETVPGSCPAFDQLNGNLDEWKKRSSA